MNDSLISIAWSSFRMSFPRFGRTRAVFSLLAFAFGVPFLPAQQPDAVAVIRGVDAAVHARADHLAGYTVTENYAVFRGKDEKQPAAQMTVRTTYRKESGKSYEILSESGSALIRKYGLLPLLDHEKQINLPGNREAAWFTSANYEMRLKPGTERGIERVDGRDCFALTIRPKRKAPNLIEGTLWVDAKDFTIVKIDGTSSSSPSLWTGAAHVERHYIELNGFGMATQAKAVSNSFLLGQSIVTIDYQNYQMQVQP
jgi:hypothetical protein